MSATPSPTPDAVRRLTVTDIAQDAMPTASGSRC